VSEAGICRAEWSILCDSTASELGKHHPRRPGSDTFCAIRPVMPPPPSPGSSQPPAEPDPQRPRPLDQECSGSCTHARHRPTNVVSRNDGQQPGLWRGCCCHIMARCPLSPMLPRVVELVEGEVMPQRVNPGFPGHMGCGRGRTTVPARLYALVKLGRQWEGPSRENSLASLGASLTNSLSRARRPGVTRLTVSDHFGLRTVARQAACRQRPGSASQRCPNSSQRHSRHTARAAMTGH